MKKVTFNGELLLTLESKADWIHNVPDRLPPQVIAAEQRIWIDRNGYCLSIGEDFEAAMQMASYPVKVYRQIRVVEVLETVKANQN